MPLVYLVYSVYNVVCIYVYLSIYIYCIRLCTDTGTYFIFAFFIYIFLIYFLNLFFTLLLTESCCLMGFDLIRFDLKTAPMRPYFLPFPSSRTNDHPSYLFIPFGSSQPLIADALVIQVVLGEKNKYVIYFDSYIFDDVIIGIISV